MLADASNDRAERALHLPVHAIVQHIEQYNGLITNEDVTIAEQLHEYFLNQLERFSVIIDLSDEQIALQLLYQLDLFCLLTTTEIVHKLVVLLLAEGQRLNLVKD